MSGGASAGVVSPAVRFVRKSSREVLEGLEGMEAVVRRVAADGGGGSRSRPRLRVKRDRNIVVVV